MKIDSTKRLPVSCAHNFTVLSQNTIRHGRWHNLVEVTYFCTKCLQTRNEQVEVSAK